MADGGGRSEEPPGDSDNLLGRGTFSARMAGKPPRGGLTEAVTWGGEELAVGAGVRAPQPQGREPRRAAGWGRRLQLGWILDTVESAEGGFSILKTPPDRKQIGSWRESGRPGRLDHKRGALRCAGDRTTLWHRGVGCTVRHLSKPTGAAKVSFIACKFC